MGGRIEHLHRPRQAGPAIGATAGAAANQPYRAALEGIGLYGAVPKGVEVMTRNAIAALALMKLA